MADRVAASIRLGGALPRALYADLAAIIAEEGLSTEWDGPAFDQSDLPNEAAPLELMAHEVAGGSFDLLETFCVEHGLPFSRSCDAYVGQWDGERVVFDGTGEPRSYLITCNDHVVIGQAEIRGLGSMDAIEAHFASAEIVIPPLTLVGEAVDHG